MKQKECLFMDRIEKEVSLKYCLYVPKGYEDRRDRKWPLILFLHGMGERGDDLELVKKHGIPRIVEERDDLPFIVISPQCPLHSTWTMKLDALHGLVLTAMKTYNVDESRIYLTGLSMGGYGAWHLAEAYPELFAAVAPICGGAVPMIGFPERIQVLKNVPIWAFHGAEDDVVPLGRSQELVDVLRRNNGNIRFTIHADAGHDSCTKTYDNPELYEWLLKQKRP